jgi:digeranylgeranylglycerophospholipid reductase
VIQVEHARCGYCGGCVSVCPVDAIELAETRLTIHESCIDCGLCSAACPVGALAEHEHGIAEQPEGQGVAAQYDVIVVGAGPAGSVAAWTAARMGLSVLLLEKRQEIGSPVRCAEGVQSEAVSEFLEPNGAWISSQVSKAEIIASVGSQVVEHWAGSGGLGYVLERRVFDRVLAERASRAGADVRVKSPVTGLLSENASVVGVTARLPDQLEVQIHAGVVIAADGVESRVGCWAGLDTRLRLEDTMVCAQYLLAGIEWDPACLGYWIDETIAPGGYAWVFPKGEGRANVGLGVQADLAELPASTYLNRFVERERNLVSGSPVTLMVGNVPVALPCRQLVTAGLMLVGDAARQVDPLTGGGIVNAMSAGKLAAEAAVMALEGGDTSAGALASYQDCVEHSLGRRLARSYRLRQRFPGGRRVDHSFVRLFSVAAAGK